MTLYDTWFQTSGMPSLFEAFGEQVTFDPANGDQQRTITVAFTARQRRDERDVTQDNLEEYEVEIGTNPQDPLYGGVYSLSVNDQILRSLNQDPDQRKFAFNGEIIAREGSRIRAVFVRARRIAQGRSK